jgi:hypothetical protein
MRQTEPWWVCYACDLPVKKVGSKNKGEKDEHKKVCPKAAYGIEQIEQRKR